MKSLRLLSLAAAIVLAVPFGYSDDQLGRKPNNGDGKGSSSQGDRRPDRKPDNGPRPREESQKPRNDDSRPRPREEPQRPPRGNDDSRPRPRQELPPPRPREEAPRPRGNDDNLKPRPNQGPPPPRDERPQPRPRNEEPPRPRINDGQLGPRPNNNPPQDRPRSNDDLIKPRPSNGNSGGGYDQNRPDRNPFPRSDNPRINEPPQNRDRGDQLGRIDPSRPRTGNDNLLGRRGSNNYGGSISNTNRSGQRSQPGRIDRAPVDILRGGLPGQVLREERFRVNRNNWRTGYYHYYNNWCDDYFWFNWYVFDPFRSSNCYVSPWYYYPHLPAYVNRRCGVFLTINLSPWYGTYYNWRRPAYYDYGYSNYNSYDYSALDYAVEDIRQAFQNMDRRAISRLIPTRDRVAIFVDGEYTYSMEPRDFEDFMLDAIEGTRTTRYEITRVERRGREAEVQARHEYEDPWGRRAVVYHHFRLEDVRGYYVISRFGTSYYR